MPRGSSTVGKGLHGRLDCPGGSLTRLPGLLTPRGEREGEEGAGGRHSHAHRGPREGGGGGGGLHEVHLDLSAPPPPFFSSSLPLSICPLNNFFRPACSPKNKSGIPDYLPIHLFLSRPVLCILPIYRFSGCN